MLAYLNVVLSVQLLLYGNVVPELPSLVLELDHSATFGANWLRNGLQLGPLLLSVMVHECAT
jgi:hypothetical protein